MPASYRPRVGRVTARRVSRPPPRRTAGAQLSQGEARQLYQAKLDVLRTGER
ncbi:hypothetical protein IAE60_11605 [Pseudoxanthomonas mexicana]|uniref:Uncharacterized protein n=1 Tax=Pseudoxanthomonas mexicana TaxID=128785 RepID=A0A7G9T915_PSEMX|nr:hypothetical protein [Pseudoxanthomonas mexicana]QNN76590.1 hypothetical protein IAE60_11605 [Pseudoxanthomonas mexicana]